MDNLYFLADHLDSATALTDTSGNVSQQESCDSLGNSAGSARTHKILRQIKRGQACDLRFYLIVVGVAEWRRLGIRRRHGQKSAC